nr:MAG TPA: KAP family P-loop domain [Caudoviricetes sp.]
MLRLRRETKFNIQAINFNSFCVAGLGKSSFLCGVKREQPRETK